MTEDRIAVAGVRHGPGISDAALEKKAFTNCIGARGKRDGISREARAMIA